MSKLEVDAVEPQSGTSLTLGASGDTITIPSGATISNQGTATGFASTSWQSVVTGSTLSAVAGRGYWIDTTSNACTVTLPASAINGDTIILVDYARKWGTNAVTINQNSLNFQGFTSPNPIYNTFGQSVTLVYSGATQGWIPTVDDDSYFETKQAYTVDFLVIAGGGGGGFDDSGGGGAGGYRNSYGSEPSGGGGSSETSLTFNPLTVYTITIGAGGAGASSNGSGTNGSNSSISGSGLSTITSTGGGAGSNGVLSGIAGGSGGGSSTSGGTGGSGTANQGYAGGTGDSPTTTGGGGGGAGEIGGTDGTGFGGDGLSSSITGSSVARGGGGSGSTRVVPAVAKQAGTGGGGTGGSGAGATTSGTANTGGGGGGGHGQGGGAIGGSGGSGIVILRMATRDYSGITTGSPLITTDGGDTIISFSASGTYTA
jgi:hypothetical protein